MKRFILVTLFLSFFGFSSALAYDAPNSLPYTVGTYTYDNYVEFYSDFFQSIRRVYYEGYRNVAYMPPDYSYFCISAPLYDSEVWGRIEDNGYALCSKVNITYDIHSSQDIVNREGSGQYPCGENNSGDCSIFRSADIIPDKTLSITRSPEAGGGVKITPPLGLPYYYCGIGSYMDCEFDVDYNAQVTLEAQHNEGYAFSHWEINSQTMGDTDGEIPITMSEDKDVAAVFARTFQDTVGNFDVTTGDECVIYVRNETGIIYDACHGEASDCFEQAQAAGYATGSEPRESAIIVFDRVPNTALAVGHVGIVISNNGDYVTMHDSNWVGYHTIGNHTELVGENGYNIKGYIYFTPHQ